MFSSQVEFGFMSFIRLEAPAIGERHLLHHGEDLDGDGNVEPPSATRVRLALAHE
jgi:hypothetical protein